MTTETVRLDALVGRLTALDEACYANEEAEKELAQLRADAARYRWLRDKNIKVALVLDKVVGEVPADEMGGGGYNIYEYRADEEIVAWVELRCTLVSLALHPGYASCSHSACWLRKKPAGFPQ